METWCLAISSPSHQTSSRTLIARALDKTRLQDTSLLILKPRVPTMGSRQETRLSLSRLTISLLLWVGRSSQGSQMVHPQAKTTASPNNLCFETLSFLTSPWRKYTDYKSTKSLTRRFSTLLRLCSRWRIEVSISTHPPWWGSQGLVTPLNSIGSSRHLV